jgi:hypothetical protein
MNDRDIRSVLKAELTLRYKKDNDTLVLDELGIKHGASRIDLVVVNHRLHGYEIKSDCDSLKRLPDQIKAYSSIMDRMTLVVGYRHAYEALRMVPEWWGVRLAEMKQQSGTVILSNARKAHDNPEVDLNAVVALLWRDEALNILEETGEAKGVRSKTRTHIYKRLVEVCKPDYLQARVRQQLKSREGWRVGAQRISCGD